MAWDVYKMSVYRMDEMMDFMAKSAMALRRFTKGFAVYSSVCYEDNGQNTWIYVSPMAADLARRLPSGLMTPIGSVPLPPDSQDLSLLLGVQGDDHPDVKPVGDMVRQKLDRLHRGF